VSFDHADEGSVQQGSFHKVIRREVPIDPRLPGRHPRRGIL